MISIYSSNPDAWWITGPASWACNLCYCTGPHSEGLHAWINPVLLLPWKISIIISEFVFGKWSPVGPWSMHVSSGNTMGGAACMCAEGSGSAGTPACLHMPQSSSECCWAGAWATLNGDGDGGSRSRGSSHGSSGSREGKGLCRDIAQPLSGGQLANPCVIYTNISSPIWREQ